MSDVKEVVSELDVDISAKMEAIASAATKPEIASWVRRRKNLDKYVEQVNEMNEKIRELKVEMEPILEKIISIRSDMVDTCIHPIDHQTPIERDGVIVIRCKFCETILNSK